jgi:cephalosporin-C deacetylase-like acetyl esterase
MKTARRWSLLFATLILSLVPASSFSADLAEELRSLDTRVIPAESDLARDLPRMLARDARARISAANQRETQEWRQITTAAEWERYRDRRLQALRDSLGRFPDPPKDLKTRVTGTVEGPGYRIRNLVFESRPGVLVTANLYVPEKPTPSMPGIVIVHSHHNPKTQGELQDMGMMWARQGCLVLVMDMPGHGERRQHPFHSATDYAGSFQPGRQDYYFRYNLGMQLHLIGDSLIGWMVWDLRRGVDLLLEQPGIGKDKIAILGAVAGGGDPAAVTAALDRRISAAAPFNFGGPQPETVYPLPEDPENRFNYAGSGSWESTRNLRLSARDGFMPWVIVGAVAPRALVYGHEFAWDRDHDPVWKRLERIYGFYNARSHLGSSHGSGAVTGRPPEATHCNNIGPVQRKGIHVAFQEWFGIPNPEREDLKRHSPEELRCLTPSAVKELNRRPLYEVAASVGEERAKAARDQLAALKPEERRQRLCAEWTKLLGDIEATGEPKVLTKEATRVGGVTAERILLEPEPGILVPVLLLVPAVKQSTKTPVVVGVAQEGKAGLLKARADAIAALLDAGVAVCLPDVRGTGETSPGAGRGRQSPAASLSSSEGMLGRTLVGLRLRDLRLTLRYLRGRNDIDSGRIAVWGDSAAPVKPSDRDLKVPLDASSQPDVAEPLGGLLALFGGLFEKDVAAIYVHGGLTSFQSVLQSPFVYVPHDVIVPGGLTAGDLGDLTATLAPRPVRLEGLVDGLNRRASAQVLASSYEPAKAAYASVKATERLQLAEQASSARAMAQWLASHLAR